MADFPQQWQNEGLGEPLDARGASVSDAAEGGGDALFDRLVGMWRYGAEEWREWRVEADEDFAFRALRQWTEEEKRLLEEQMRQPIVFDQCGSFIDAICGMEVGNRQEPVVVPRTADGHSGADLITAGLKWLRDNCDGEDEESRSFRDMATCGLGTTQTTMDYAHDPDGLGLLVRIDPREMIWDPDAKRPNYSDARYVFRGCWKAIDAARELCPDASDADLHASWAASMWPDTEGDQPHDQQEAAFYREDQSGRLPGAGWGNRGKVFMVEAEWIEMVDAYRVLDPTSNTYKRLKDDELDTLRERMKTIAKLAGTALAPFKSVKEKIPVVRRAVLGAKVLSEGDGPEEGGFTFKAMVAKVDETTGRPYGLMRSMKDPQRWGNKALSQMIHMINISAKQGAFVETGAFTDMDQAKEDWAKPGSLIVLKNGGLGKIKERESPPFPAAYSQLMEIAMSAAPRAVGFSPEMLGQTDRDQPGVVEMQRKQQGMAILSEYFSAMRRYRKEWGRLGIYYVQNFIPDGKMLRIGGRENAQYLPFLKDKTLGEYECVVDDAPSSPNMKERVWSSLMQIAPMMTRMEIPPAVWMQFLKYSPLPDAIVANIEQIMQQQSQNPQQKPTSPLDASKAALHQAQAGEVSAKTAKIQAETQLLPQQMQTEASERAARIESLKAAAMANMAKAQLMPDQARAEAMSQALDGLLQAHGAHIDETRMAHEHAMDRAGLQQAAQQQALAGNQAAQQASIAERQQSLAENPPEQGAS